MQDVMTTEMIYELITGLLDIFRDNIQEIILYGSVARNQETDESDIDIAVVLKHEFNTEVKKKFIEWSAELDLKYEKIFSIVDIEKEYLDKWGEVLPFYKNIRQEGVVLWKAA